ncbi:MAG: PA0069 family radical SAM protein, partial [Burkholderiales bacterium]|nr:PA0069 family radical SAM protein [Burkholderiales bacterium]
YPAHDDALAGRHRAAPPQRGRLDYHRRRQHSPGSRGGPQKGRGATSNLAGRFESLARDPFDDGWPRDADAPPPPRTEVVRETARTIIARNDSPDIPFDQSINPYRGCEHGCPYCYARPSHAYLGLSPGLDFETRIFAKVNAAELLVKELAAPGYTASPIALGSNTDPYQPAERELGITRSILAVLAACDHPATIVTKSALVERDIDLLAPMAAKRLVRAYVSVTNLDADLARTLEPRAAAPWRRLETIRRLADAGIPVGVLVAPVIPFLTDRFLEEILERAAAAGAASAGYILLRLPHEVAPVMKAWLAAHHPLKAEHVMSLVRQMRGGRDYESAFGVRQTGRGQYAELIARRFAVAARRLGLDGERAPLDTSRFRPPKAGPQLDLF